MGDLDGTRQLSELRIKQTYKQQTYNKSAIVRVSGYDDSA